MAVRKSAATTRTAGGPERAKGSDLSADEYRHCRELLLENVRSMDRNEVYTLGAVAVTMGFSLSATNAAVAIVSGFVPLGLSYVARLRYKGIGIMTRALNDFMERKEKGNPSISWTTYHRRAGAGRFLRENRFFFWNVLMTGCAAFLLFRIASVAVPYFDFAKQSASPQTATQERR